MPRGVTNFTHTAHWVRGFITIVQADSPAEATDDTLRSLVRSVCVTPWVDVNPHVAANSATELLADLALSATDPEVLGHARGGKRG